LDNIMFKFYKSGLRFECTQCGECCRLPGGKIIVTYKDLKQIANYLDLNNEELLKKFCTTNRNNIFLKDSDKNYCIFLEDNHCRIYEVRPLQCRTFPFWPENLKSKYRWKLVKLYCSGIDQGPIFSYEKIQEISKKQKVYYKDLKKKL
jgi:Fe-S-cluster containining protein